MAPTSENRIETAAKLRQMADEHDATEASRVACALGLEYKVYGTVVAFDSADIRHIADLIDYTCKNKADELNRMAPLEMRTDNLICSACGETFCADSEGVNFPIDWAYCPECGARVVNE